MYQRRIDWRAVAASRIRFAIVRATLGNSYVDPAYRRNVRGATQHGLVVGAYHFAKPGRGRWDARAEANHFLRVARNGPGDLVPVLDLENSGGLSPRQLWRWTRRWLTRVREQTGLRAMIYTGSLFWTHSMGNTPWFGRHGYPHWVAHWYARRPDVPGGGWGGLSWTLWQWSASGRVPGIRGPVDLDWFDGRDVRAGTIASLSVAPAEGGEILGPMLECGAGRSRCRRLANPGSPITLRARPAPGARLLRWTGACAGAGSAPTCRLTARGALAASAVFDGGQDAGDSAAASLTARAGLHPFAHLGCRGFDPDCAIAALLSNGLGTQLREVLPSLLTAHGQGSSTDRPPSRRRPG